MTIHQETPVTTVHLVRKALSVTVEAVTHVATPPERVWSVLTDTDAYPSWNPFVRSISGQLVAGERLTVALKPTDAEPRTMAPTVVEVVPGRSFTWLGKVGVRGVLDGRHRFTVTADGDGSRLVQHERLSGLLVPAFRRLLTVDTPAAFVASNDALKARAELDG